MATDTKQHKRKRLRSWLRLSCLSGPQKHLDDEQAQPVTKATQTRQFQLTAESHTVLADEAPVAATVALHELEPTLVLQPTPSLPGPSTAHTTSTTTPVSPSHDGTAHGDAAQPAESDLQADIMTEAILCSTNTWLPAVSVRQQVVTLINVILLCTLRFRVSMPDQFCCGWSVVASFWCAMLNSTRWRRSAKVCQAAVMHWMATVTARAVVYCTSVVTAWALNTTVKLRLCHRMAMHMLAWALKAAGQVSATADWRLLLSAVGSVGVMLFVHSLMEWVWDVSLVVLPQALCAVSCGVAVQAVMTTSLLPHFLAATRLAAFANFLSAVRARSNPRHLDLTGSQRRQLKRLLQDRDHELQMDTRQLAMRDDTIQRLVGLLEAEHLAKKRLMSSNDTLAAELQRQEQQLGLQASSIADQQSQISSLTAELGSCQQQLSEKDAHLARQQLQLAAEKAKVDRLTKLITGRQAADAVVREERDAALARADSKHELLGRVAARLKILDAKLVAETQRASTAEQRASTAEQSSADSATRTQALHNELAAKNAELGAARSRLCALADPSSGAAGVQGQLQWESLPGDQQRPTSHTNPLFIQPMSPLHASLPAHDGPVDPAMVASTSTQQVAVSTPPTSHPTPAPHTSTLPQAPLNSAGLAVETALVQGLPAVSQGAFDFFHAKAMQSMNTDEIAKALPMKTLHAVSADFEQTLRGRRQGEKQHSPLQWKRHACSPVVQVLEDEAEGKLGAGKAVVTYCQIAMADGTVQAGALKRLNYWCPDAIIDSEAELAGLQAALGLPHLVQCLAAFKYGGAEDCDYLAVITKYLPGLELERGFFSLVRQMRDSSVTRPERGRKLFAASQVMTKQMAVALDSLHALGVGHCDVKHHQIRTVLGSDTDLACCTLADMGSSSGYSGPWNLKPRHLKISVDFGAPEMVLGECFESCKRSSSHHICAKAQDVWALGCLTYWGLTGKQAFCSVPLALPGCLHAIREQHQTWAATFAGAAEGEEPPEAHPILTQLRGQMSDDAQYAAVSHILRRMLHPHVQQRATIKEVLAADLFTKY